MVVIAVTNEKGGVGKTTIRNTVRMRDAARYRQPISLYEPDGGATGDFRALANEVLARLPQLVRG